MRPRSSLLGLSVLLGGVAAGIIGDPSGQVPFLDDAKGGSDPKVNVTLYVMSRCPDAVLDTTGIKDKIDFNLQFVAKLNESEPLGISCMHGEQECYGNAHDLCLLKHLPLSEFYAALSCQNFQSPFPGKIGDVALTRRCAEAAKVDWWKSGAGQCIQGHRAEKDDGKRAEKDNKLGKEARGLVLDNVRETIDRGVQKSCTIEIGSAKGKEGKRLCQVDGGVWTGCDDGHSAADFVRVIEEEWKALQDKKLLNLHLI